MFNTLKKKKAWIFVGLLTAAMMLAIDLNLVDGLVFQVAQITSSFSALAIKVGLLAKS